jgi:hypothetical protein
MQHNKRKNISETMQSKERCKMRICIYTKQIGNCLNNLVIAKQVPQFMKTLSKRNSETSHISHKVSQEGHIRFYSQSHKLVIGHGLMAGNIAR